MSKIAHVTAIRSHPLFAIALPGVPGFGNLAIGYTPGAGVAPGMAAMGMGAGMQPGMGMGGGMGGF